MATAALQDSSFASAPTRSRIGHEILARASGFGFTAMDATRRLAQLAGLTGLLIGLTVARRSTVPVGLTGLLTYGAWRLPAERH